MIRAVLATLLPLVVLLLATALACGLVNAAAPLFGAGSAPKTLVKTTQVVLLLSLIPIARWLKLNSSDWGFAAWPEFGRQLGTGFVLGVVTLLPVFILLTALGVNVPDVSQNASWLTLAGNAALALLLATLVSLLEEPLFRGALLAGLGKATPKMAAVGISAAYYAALHFIKSGQNLALQDLTAANTVALVADAFAHLSHPDVPPAFWALFMVGVFLGVVRSLRPNSLGLCIGCHSAWVWLIKLDKNWFNTDFAADDAFLVSRYDGVIGPLVTLWLILALLGYGAWWWLRRVRN